MKRFPEIIDLLLSVVRGRELSTGILASQMISNVPVAILLSGLFGMGSRTAESNNNQEHRQELRG